MQVVPARILTSKNATLLWGGWEVRGRAPVACCTLGTFWGIVQVCVGWCHSGAPTPEPDSRERSGEWSWLYSCDATWITSQPAWLSTTMSHRRRRDIYLCVCVYIYIFVWDSHFFFFWRKEILEDDVRSVWPSISQSLEHGYQACNFYKGMFPSCSHVTDEHSGVMKIWL